MSYDIRPISYVKGVGKVSQKLLNKLGVSNFDALVHYYPKDYENWYDITRLCDAQADTEVCVRAKITSDIKESYYKSNMILFRFTAFDRTGALNVTLFNNKFLAKSLKKGEEYLFYGKLKRSADGISFNMSSPKIRDIGSASLIPIYRLTKGLYNKTLERIMKNALSSIEKTDFLPEYLITKYKLMSEYDALCNIHFPKNEAALLAAKRRLSFDELFLMMTGQELIKNRHSLGSATAITKNRFCEFEKTLPFKLTASQVKSIKECLSDMSTTKPMNRLLEGDVGSGKTVVAAALIDTAAAQKEKSVLMAPTGVLALQHYNTFKKFLPKLNIEILTGQTKKAEKERIKTDFKDDKIDLLIGTHAVITETTDLSNTALAITDEQHRFGVKARALLKHKSGIPHTLYMSATPIPRTLGLIIYGELDISIIDELPKGRKPVETYHINSSIRKRAFNYVKKQLDEGRQAYIICSVVEEGETELLSAKEYYKKISGGFFKDYRVGLVHGKMTEKQKDEVMTDFKNHKIDLLVATTIIEVGVDVPNASIMLVENAERFGLATLHQLRGRIGRGQYKSTFIMISDFDTERFRIICDNSDGFSIAEADLALRGPGEFLGHKQHGLPELKMADFIKDSRILKVASDEAKALVYKDNNLANHPLLYNKIQYMFENLDLEI